MQSQSRREEKSVQIFTALLLFVLVVGAGGVLLALGYWALGSPGRLSAAPFPVLLAAGAVAAVAYLVRAGRR